MKKVVLLKTIVWDIVLLTCITCISLSLISVYFHARFLDTGYPDWMVHAYRIKLLQTNGFTSWTHMWANGIDIWKSYQFVPHLLTLAVINIFHVSVTRGMVYITIFLFVFIHLSIYLFLRFLSFSPFTALFCSLASLDVAQFWGGVSDFSLLFGFAFFPLFLYLWIRFYRGSIQYFFPFIVGISFYIHPLLGLSFFTLMMLGVIFSPQQIITLKTALQVCIFTIASCLFWFPIVYRDSYTYTSPYLSNVFFLRQVIQNYPYLGFSAFIFVMIPLSLIGIFLWQRKDMLWANVLYFFAFGYFLLFLIGINYQLPHAIAQLQFTRGATMIAYSFIFVFALFLEKVFTAKSHFIKILVIAFLIPIIIDGNSLLKTFAPTPTDHISDTISSYTNQPINDGKIWTNAIGPSSYFSPETYQFPYSYMGQLDPNIISPRISQMILYAPYSGEIPQSNIERMTEYFKITGTKYAFFDNDSGFSHALTDLSYDDGYINLGVVRSYESVSRVFKVPFDPINATILSPKNSSHLFVFPKNLDISKTSGQMAIDQDVEKLNTVIYQKDNLPLTVHYPSSDTLTVTIPSSRPSNTVYIAESFDKDWHATLNKQQIMITPAGPNFMRLTIPNGVSGKLLLSHTFPLYMVVGTGLIVILFADLCIYYAIRLFYSL